MWLETISLLIILYFLGGLTRIISDITKPDSNKPLYVRNPILILFVLIAWLPLRIKEIKEAGGIRKFRQIEKDSKFLEDSIKEGKNLTEIEELLKKRNKQKLIKEKEEKFREFGKRYRKERPGELENKFNEWHNSKVKFTNNDKETFEELVNLSKVTWLSTRAQYLYRQGKTDEAIDDLTEAIEIKSDFTPAYIALGANYRELGQLDKSLSVLLKAPSSKEFMDFIPPNSSVNVDLFITIASIYALQGNKSKARQYLEKALSFIKSREMEREIELKREEITKSVSEVQKELEDSVMKIIKDLEIENNNL